MFSARSVARYAPMIVEVAAVVKTEFFRYAKKNVKLLELCAGLLSIANGNEMK